MAVVRAVAPISSSRPFPGSIASWSLLLLWLLLAAPSDALAGNGATDGPGAAPRHEASGPVRSALREHGWHLAAILGGNVLVHEYHTAVGASSDPLFFSVPGELDTRLRHEVSGSHSGNFVWGDGPQALSYGVPLALAAINTGDGGLMTRDLLGFLETLYTNGAAVGLLKDVIGRERPRLEFAEEDGLSRQEIAELEEKGSNYRSFPSGHASAAFTAAAYMERVVAREVGMDSAWRKVSWISFYGLAGWIGYGRMRVDKHYFSDIVAGAAIGTWIARRYYRHAHPEEYGKTHAFRGGRSRRITFHPPSMGPGGGVALTVGFRLGAPRASEGSHEQPRP